MILTFDEIKAETDKAVLVKFGDFECWLPKSQISNWPEAQEDSEIDVADWLVEEHGLEVYEID